MLRAATIYIVYYSPLYRPPCVCTPHPEIKDRLLGSDVLLTKYWYADYTFLYLHTNTHAVLKKNAETSGRYIFVIQDYEIGRGVISIAFYFSNFYIANLFLTIFGFLFSLHQRQVMTRLVRSMARQAQVRATTTYWLKYQGGPGASLQRYLNNLKTKKQTSLDFRWASLNFGKIN